MFLTKLKNLFKKPEEELDIFEEFKKHVQYEVVISKKTVISIIEAEGYDVRDYSNRIIIFDGNLAIIFITYETKKDYILLTRMGPCTNLIMYSEKFEKYKKYICEGQSVKGIRIGQEGELIYETKRY